MGEIAINGSSLGNALQQLLMCDEIVPGSDIGYETAKNIFLWHPLGRKMVEIPINIAMSQARKIAVPSAPEGVKKQFEKVWGELGVDKNIFNVMRQARIYGVASVIYGAVDFPTDEPMDLDKLAELDIYFNVLDPLNTAGSLVLNQDPNSPDFQKHGQIRVSGQTYHSSRACVMLNEEPIYIAYTNSAFGYVGRSVYQRALFPLKSFVQSMVTDDMVTRKAGVLVAAMKAVGSIVDRLQQSIAGVKRALLQEAQTNNVISIQTEERIETLNMQNTDTAMTTARKNILENIAAADDMPAKLMNSETMAEGFGEGTEDAKQIARYADRFRMQMEPLYQWFENIVMHRAWSQAFYETIRADYPEYRRIPFKTAFADWKNSFTAEWPSLLIEPESERVKTDDVKLKGIIAAIEVLGPLMDKGNKALLIQAAIDNINENKIMFKVPFQFDAEAFLEDAPDQTSTDEDETEPSEPKPFAMAA